MTHNSHSPNAVRTHCCSCLFCDKLKMARDQRDSELDLSLEHSDDEAPEEVTFESARDVALRRVRNGLDTAKREKSQLKDKRRKRQELFQEQKKRRLLPTDVLNEIDSAVPKEQAQSEGEDPEKPAEDKFPYSRNLTETYTVTTRKDHMSYQQQAAQDFLHSRFYGPGSRRTTNNELLSLQNKKGMHKQAAVQFVKKHWASKKKAKAEKLKQCWIHKQKILP